MNEKAKVVFGSAAIIGAAIVGAGYLAAPPRYSIAGTGAGVAYRLDRRTGDLLVCATECEAVSLTPKAKDVRAPTENSQGYLSLDPANSN